jgi:hypothetical protein
MKKKTRLSPFMFAAIVISLILNACSPNLPMNSVVIGSTSTPTASNSSQDNNPIPTATSRPEEVPSDPSAAPAVQNINICGFFTPSDAEPIVGTALIEATAGSDSDEVTGGILNYCTYKGDDTALVISLAESNAVKDSAEWQGQLSEMTNADEASITPFPGLGEQAYWVVTEDSAGFDVAKYPYIFVLAIGGNIGYSEDYKENLLNLAQRVVDSLP